MANKLKLSRGKKNGMPALLDGEPAFATDEKALYVGLNGENVKIASPPDTSLSTTSENPVQNKVVTAELNNKANKSTIVPNNNLQGSGRPNKPTWYRIAEFSGTNEFISKGSTCNSCEIIIKRKFENYNNEFHHLYLSSIYWGSEFGSIANKTAAYSQGFTKIRHVYNSADKKAYIDVYHFFNTGNITNVYINNGVTSGGYWKPISWFSETAETAENETILSTYNIPANSKNLTSTDVDTGLSTTSTNPVQNKVVQAELAKKANAKDIPLIDTALSTTSTNPLQNKVITAEINKLRNYSTIPQQIGTWIDDTPIWRVAFKYYLQQIDIEDMCIGASYGYCPPWSELVNSDELVQMLNGEALLCDGTDNHTRNCSLGKLWTLGIDGDNEFYNHVKLFPPVMENNPYIYGYVEFITPASNIKT